MDKNESGNLKLAVIIPCFNEELTIATVIHDFRKFLPDADIHVFDNASTDETASVARCAGATVHEVNERGKGKVVRAMFRDIDADCYVMVDGDGTYPANHAPEMVNLMKTARADMIVGNRMGSFRNSNSRSGHFFGNRLLTRTVNRLFHGGFRDLLSGYRVLSRRFVKSIPLFSRGFEVETAISVHAMEVDAKILEMPVSYSERTAGSASKLHTIKDGIGIVLSIFRLFRDCKPRLVYGFVAAAHILAGLIVGVPVILEYLETGLVPRFPSAVLASALILLGFLFGMTGIILSAISKSRREVRKLTFLSMQSWPDRCPRKEAGYPS